MRGKLHTRRAGLHLSLQKVAFAKPEARRKHSKCKNTCAQARTSIRFCSGVLGSSRAADFGAALALAFPLALLHGSEAQQSVTDVVAPVLWPLPACAANLSSARRGLEAAQNRCSGAYSVSQ